MEVHRMLKCVPTWPVWLMAPPAVRFVHSVKKGTFELVNKSETEDPPLCLTHSAVELWGHFNV